MAYSQTLNLVVGDNLPELTLTLKDSNSAAAGYTLDPDDSATWDPIDITGATIRLRLREIGTTTVTSTLTCSVTQPTDGVAITNFPTGTLNKAGVFEGEVEIEFNNGNKQTVYDLLKIKVRDDFD